jgi:hypothetical protein
MRTELRVAPGPIGALCLATALLSGCGDRAEASVPAVAPQGPAAQSQVSPSRSAHALDAGAGFSSTRCQQFAQNFDELAACRRADGTLQAFTDSDIRWRVRYFVRYWQMPCNEAPTIEEGYVYHMVTKDLYKDHDLNDRQRMDIRAAMFDGRVNCK